MVDRAARTVRRQFPDAITCVGHLSREGGGEVDRHRSHESGRDVDVGFFVRSAGGKQLLEQHFVPFRADATAPSWPGAHFDDAKNWAFVAAILNDDQARVSHVFVASALRARLLAYAERIVVMHAGQIVEEAPTDRLFAAPRHPYSAALLSATPANAGTVADLKGIPGNLPKLGVSIPACRFAERCARAIPRCRSERPAFVFDTSRHGAACWVSL